jgi:carboxypeptidase C (cathepsin A)
MIGMRQILVFILVLFAELFVQAQTPRLSVTNGVVTANGKEIRYKATVREIFLPIKGNPVASAIVTSYEMEGADQKSRPLVFLFNGGPGASSSPLHMYAFGPVRLQKGPDSTRQISNAYSLLDVADLVFIDPVGTGFTQVLDEEKASVYWDVAGDAQAVIDIIKYWREENYRNASPFFICGESYGTVRAGEMLGIAEDFPVKGILLFASVLDFSVKAPVTGNEMPYILDLPSMAAVAWYHQKINRKGKTAEQYFAAAGEYAKGDYLNALFQGNTISEKQKHKVAAKLSELIGISTKSILDRNLRVTTDDFEMLLLEDKGLRIGKLNAQITAPVPKEKKPYSSREDPSLIVNTALKGDYVGKYFVKTLGFPGTGLYRGVNFDVNGKWKWNSMDAYLGYFSVVPGLEKAMKENPHLRLLVAGGMYDLATPLYAARYMLEHSSIPKDRTTFLSFPTGHSIFDSEEQLAKLANEVRSFVLK